MDHIRNLINKDIARNYFILLSMASGKDIYSRIIGQWENKELIALLFRRRSKVLQFYGNGDFAVDEFANIISKMDYNLMIGPKSYCHKFLGKGIFSNYREGAYISKLPIERMLEFNHDDKSISTLKLEHMDQVVELYHKVFKGSATKEVMVEKLRSGRGRGLCIKNKGKIVSVVQTDFENKNQALIVGVATEPTYQNRGLGTQCLKAMINELQGEKKDIYLQYDNPMAGAIYDRLGFYTIDQVYHYT